MWILVEVDSPQDVGLKEKRRILINCSEVHPATPPCSRLLYMYCEFRQIKDKGRTEE
jgi:hypothetical protein